jgi:hypothetical protein
MGILLHRPSGRLLHLLRLPCLELKLLRSIGAEALGAVKTQKEGAQKERGLRVTWQRSGTNLRKVAPSETPGDSSILPRPTTSTQARSTVSCSAEMGAHHLSGR